MHEAAVVTADLLALLESDPAAGILAVAELREQRAAAVHPGYWYAGTSNWIVAVVGEMADEFDVVKMQSAADAEHIAAEANPAHALAAVRRWRGVVERHVPAADGSSACDSCGWRWAWPCPELTETVAEATAYLGGTQ